MIRVLPADARYRDAGDGITSWHCFAAGAHYDPDNTSWGRLIGFDEHRLQPGAGFTEHAHRGVDIVSWVLSGALRHTGETAVVVRPGQVLLQHGGAGIRHTEVNADPGQPLRLVQMTLLASAAAVGTRLLTPPVDLGDARFEVQHEDTRLPAGRWHLFVARGGWQLAGPAVGTTALSPGDSARGDGAVTARGAGELLVWRLT